MNENKIENDFIKPELVVGAGDLERLKVAAHFGADAIYCGTSDFSLRAKAKNFSYDELSYAVSYLHKLNKKIYITVNSVIHETKLEDLKKYLLFINEINADAIIFSDMAVLEIANELKIKPKLHLSTQASVANSYAINFFIKNNVSRINLARECSIAEIKLFPKFNNISLEAFIHGAMCVSYSGRCLLSNYLAYRGANDGMCAQACRWKYYLVEEKRPNDYFEIVENFEGTGTYIFNSRDLMALDLLPDLYNAGVRAFKVEGRIKGPHYVGVVTLAYRKAFDEFYNLLINNQKFIPKNEIYEMLYSVSNRGYTTGFYINKPDASSHNYDSAKYIKTYRLVGIIKQKNDADEYIISVRNNIYAGKQYEVVSNYGIFKVEVVLIRKIDNEIISKAVNETDVILTIKSINNEVILPSFEEFDLIRELNSD